MDKEKVIKALNQHCNGSMFDRCGKCPYYYYKITHEPFECKDKLLEDVFTLLKEQEPKPVRLEKFPVNEPLSHCPTCGIELSSFTHHPSELRPKYCPICGQAVKWE